MSAATVLGAALIGAVGSFLITRNNIQKNTVPPKILASTKKGTAYIFHSSLEIDAKALRKRFEDAFTERSQNGDLILYPEISLDDFYFTFNENSLKVALNVTKDIHQERIVVTLYPTQLVIKELSNSKSVDMLCIFKKPSTINNQLATIIGKLNAKRVVFKGTEVLKGTTPDKPLIKADSLDEFISNLISDIKEKINLDRIETGSETTLVGEDKNQLKDIVSDLSSSNNFIPLSNVWFDEGKELSMYFRKGGYLIVKIKDLSTDTESFLFPRDPVQDNKPIRVSEIPTFTQSIQIINISTYADGEVLKEVDLENNAVTITSLDPEVWILVKGDDSASVLEEVPRTRNVVRNIGSGGPLQLTSDQKLNANSFCRVYHSYYENYILKPQNVSYFLSKRVNYNPENGPVFKFLYYSLEFKRYFVMYLQKIQSNNSGWINFELLVDTNLNAILNMNTSTNKFTGVFQVAGFNESYYNSLNLEGTILFPADEPPKPSTQITTEKKNVLTSETIKELALLHNKLAFKLTLLNNYYRDTLSQQFFTNVFGGKLNPDRSGFFKNVPLETKSYPLSEAVRYYYSSNGPRCNIYYDYVTDVFMVRLGVTGEKFYTNSDGNGRWFLLYLGEEMKPINRAQMNKIAADEVQNCWENMRIKVPENGVPDEYFIIKLREDTDKEDAKYCMNYLVNPEKRTSPLIERQHFMEGAYNNDNGTNTKVVYHVERFQIKEHLLSFFDVRDFGITDMERFVAPYSTSFLKYYPKRNLKIINRVHETLEYYGRNNVIQINQINNLILTPLAFKRLKSDPSVPVLEVSGARIHMHNKDLRKNFKTNTYDTYYVLDIVSTENDNRPLFEKFLTLLRQKNKNNGNQCYPRLKNLKGRVIFNGEGGIGDVRMDDDRSQVFQDALIDF